MLKGRLLASVCALGLLAAAPAFAADPTTGNTTPAPAGSPATTGSQNNATNAPNPGGSAGAATNTQSAAGTNGGTAGMSNAANANATTNSGTGMNSTATGMNSPSVQRSHPANARSHTGMHASDTHESRHAMRMSRSGRTDTSQDAAVADLNQQSLQAAQQGHSFQVGSGPTSENGMSNQGASPGTMGGMNSGGMTGSQPSTGNK